MSRKAIQRTSRGMTWQNCKKALRVHMPKEESQLNSRIWRRNSWISSSNPNILPTHLFNTSVPAFAATNV